MWGNSQDSIFIFFSFFPPVLIPSEIGDGEGGGWGGGDRDRCGGGSGGAGGAAADEELREVDPDEGAGEGI